MGPRILCKTCEAIIQAKIIGEPVSCSCAQITVIGQDEKNWTVKRVAGSQYSIVDDEGHEITSRKAESEEAPADADVLPCFEAVKELTMRYEKAIEAIDRLPDAGKHGPVTQLDLLDHLILDRVAFEVLVKELQRSHQELLALKRQLAQEARVLQSPDCDPKSLE